MEIQKGSLRLVLVFDKFVIKFPRILRQFKKAVLIVYGHYTLSKKDYFSRHFIHELFYFIRVFMNPIKHNWSEFVFYQKNKSAFCAKTYFSFFGLFNVQEKITFLQKYDSRNGYELSRYSEYKEIIIKVIYKSELKSDFSQESHTYNNPYNFGFSKDCRFVCIDYSEVCIQEVILSLGFKLHEALKDWNKE